MKKLLMSLLVVAMVLGLSACQNNKEKNIEGTLDEIMDKIYDGVSEDSLPMMLERVELNSENEFWYIGTDKLEYKEALASESGIGSIAYSVVLIRLEENADVEAAKSLLKDSIDPRKWICVGVEDDEVVIESNGNLILVVLDGSGSAETLQNNFMNLK